MEDSEPPSNLNNYLNSETNQISKERPLNLLIKTEQKLINNKQKLIKVKKRQQTKEKIREIKNKLKKTISRKQEEKSYSEPSGIPSEKGEENLKRIILEPDNNYRGLEIATIARINCAIPEQGLNGRKPILFRRETTKKTNKPFHELKASERISDIMLGWLENPYTLTNEKKVILNSKPGISYEDPDIALIDKEFYISAVRYNQENAQINLFTTPNLEDITDLGIISPNMTLKRAIELVDDEKVKKIWEKEYHDRLKRLTQLGDLGKKIYQEKGILLWDKDMILRKKEKFEMIHRLIPNVQIAIAENIEDFQNIDYQEDYIAHLKQNTMITAEELGYERIGLKALVKLGDKKISLLHGVLKNKCSYETGLCEIKDNQMVSTTPPIITPTEQDIFKYVDKGKTKSKFVALGSALIVDEESDKLYAYYNSRDERVIVQEFSATKAYDDLNNPKNRRVA